MRTVPALLCLALLAGCAAPPRPMTPVVPGTSGGDEDAPLVKTISGVRVSVAPAGSGFPYRRGLLGFELSVEVSTDTSSAFDAGTVKLYGDGGTEQVALSTGAAFAALDRELFGRESWRFREDRLAAKRREAEAYLTEHAFSLVDLHPGQARNGLVYFKRVPSRETRLVVACRVRDGGGKSILLTFPFQLPADQRDKHVPDDQEPTAGQTVP